jgi:hypothetical protein
MSVTQQFAEAHGAAPPRPEKPSYRFRGELPSELAPLAALPQWLVWDYTLNKKGTKWDKPPRHVETGDICDGTDPDNLGTLAVAINTQRRESLSGIGFSPQPGDGFTFVDIDDCITDTGTYTALAAEILGYGETYAEVSPSGEGLRLIVAGKIDAGFECDAIGVEVYTRRHYVTITGHKLPDTPGIGPAPRTIARLRAAVDAAKEQTAKPNGHAGARQYHPNDVERIREALRYIPSDDRGVWINVGMGIKDDLGEAGYSLWLEWSQTCPDKFDASDTRHKWNSFKGAGITIATVFGMARDHGWREQRKYYDGDRAKPAVALRARPDMGIVQRNQVEVRPFPLDVFGKAAADWVLAAAEGKAAPPDYLALGLLVAAAAIVGPKRRVSPWGEWEEPSILWGALVGPPSFSKSPSTDPFREALSEIERDLNFDWETRSKEYEEAKQLAETIKDKWEKDVTAAVKVGKDPPAMPAGATPPKPQDGSGSLTPPPRRWRAFLA